MAAAAATAAAAAAASAAARWRVGEVGVAGAECGASRDSTEILRDCVVLRLLLRFPKTFDFRSKMQGDGVVFLGSQRY